MECKCRNCGTYYEYNRDVGYAKDICGVFCDALHIGIKQVQQQAIDLGHAEMVDGEFRWKEHEHED